jgi:hydrogenase/urease accessory protein HupE
LPETIRTAERRGMTVRAWTVFLHNGALAEAHPDCAPESAFGDRYVTDLCPAHPDVRAYARALAADVARLGIATICAESLHYHGLEHGYAHERYFVPLSARVRYLLGLCFCEHCLAAARAQGVDGDAVRRAARAEIERAFDGADDEREPERDEYARVRELVVTSLVEEVAEAAGDSAFEFIELCGAVKGYATGRPTGGPAREIAWQFGIDVDAVAGACAGLQAVGYAVEPERIQADLDAYGDTAVTVIYRPGPPDCDAAENLREKVALARARDLKRVDFYHYGLMRLDALDRIRSAVT